MKEKKTPPKNEKKQKPRYIDDGRSFCDMTQLDKAYGRTTRQGPGQRPTFRGCLKTYWESVKMMFLPMLVTLGIVSLAFLIMWLLTYAAT